MTTDNTQAMKQALEALENSDFDFDKRQAACAALINALSMTTQAQLVMATTQAPPAPDKAAIKAALKAGQDVQGARLTTGQRLVVS